MSLKIEVFDKLSALLTAAMGLVAALAWNNAITAAFELYVQPRFGGSGQLGILASYALFVTILAVLATVWLGRVLARAKDLHFPLGWTRSAREGIEPPPLG